MSTVFKLFCQPVDCTVVRVFFRPSCKLSVLYILKFINRWPIGDITNAQLTAALNTVNPTVAQIN